MAFRGCNQIDGYGQYFQDVVVTSLLAYAVPNASTFIDLAANDAVVNSNTVYMDKCLHWSGICVEPNPKYHLGFLDRTCELQKVCVSSRTGTRNFKFMDGLGHIDPSRRRLAEVNCMRMDHIMESARFRRVSYLSLDIEGHEFEAMRSWNWRRNSIDVMTVENAKKPFVEYMARHGMHALQCVSLDLILVNTHIYNKATEWLDSLNEKQKSHWCLRHSTECIDSTVSFEACHKK